MGFSPATLKTKDMVYGTAKKIGMEVKDRARLNLKDDPEKMKLSSLLK